MTSKQLVQQVNHPQKGDVIKVEPFKSLDEIRKVKSVIKSERDLAIFTVATNTNFRASDLLNLKVGQVRDLNAGDDFLCREKKTGKSRRTTINRVSYEAIQSIIKVDAADDDFLFQSQRTGEALKVPVLNSMVKTWAFRAGIRGNFGSHTLRKTWAFCQYFIFKTPIAVLMEALNHSSQRQTLAYICVQPEDVKSAYLNEIE